MLLRVSLIPRNFFSFLTFLTLLTSVNYLIILWINLVTAVDMFYILEIAFTNNYIVASKGNEISTCGQTKR